MYTLIKFIRYYGPYKTVFFLDLLCAAIISLVDLAFPQILRTLTATVFTEEPSTILKAGVYITDLSAVIHKGFLHSPVLLHGKHQHDQYQDQKRNCQSPVNKKQENK